MERIIDLNHGEDFGMYVLIKGADVRVARNGNPFIAFRFQDQSGSIDGMYWSATDDEVADFQAGKVVFLRGRRDTYQGTPQVKIESIRIAEEGEPNDPQLYVQRIDVSQAKLEEQLDNALLKIREPNIARIVRKIFAKIGQDFFTFPAAKRNHHAVAGGLAYHTLSMVNIGLVLLEIYPHINQSLLIGGILLHDLGKIYELSGPISTEYTLKGQLVGHIVLISEMIDNVCQELGIDCELESVILLKHMVLSHHGKLEFGSPVIPRLLEAEIMHYIDDLDAKINMISNAMEGVEPGTFSPQIYPLDRREFYQPKFDS